MKLFVAFTCVVFCLFFPQSIFAQRNLQQEASILFQVIPESAPKLEDNPYNAAKFELGKMLFFEPRLSASQLISCNTCHNMGLYGIDLQENSVGHGWRSGLRNAPTVLNAVFNVAQFWDGRAEDLEEQARGPVQRAVEMNNTPQRAVMTLQSIPEYAALFEQAFPEDMEPVRFDNLVKAIELFEASLLTPDAPVDLYMKGNATALSSREKEGLALFIDKNCAACHYGINFGARGYYPFGIIREPGDGVKPVLDLGRYEVTANFRDRYVFRAAPLRNVARTPPYFHAGRVWTLVEAVEIMGAAQLGYALDRHEAQTIAYFLSSLTGPQPRIAYPQLPPRTEATPKPNLTLPD